MKLTNQDIIDLFDLNPNLTLAQLSRITGKSVLELKQILMGQS
jgi:hypothetical protein